MLAEPPISERTRKPDSLTRSFIAVIVIYQVVQAGIFSLYAIPFSFFTTYILPFGLASAGFHVAIFALLLVFKGDFVVEPSGRRLDRVNLANAITLFRLSTLPTILFVILASKDHPMRFQLVALIAVVFATDFLDGYVSRRGKETTRIGRMMDSASDYSLLFVISLVFYYFHIIPAWFLALLVLRLGGQALMLLAVLAVKKRLTPKTSFLGKATVASTMILYAFELLRFAADIPRIAFASLEYAAGAIIAVSIVDKIMMMVRDLKAPATVSTDAGRLNPIDHGVNDGVDKKRA